MFLNIISYVNIFEYTKKKSIKYLYPPLLSRNINEYETNDYLQVASQWWVQIKELGTHREKPSTRRSHSSTIYKIHDMTQYHNSTTNNSNFIEYMIMCGGFTDDDWTTFPLWAFDMTSAAKHGEGKWINITPNIGNCNINNKTNIEDNNDINIWNYASKCSPPSRIGHISFIYNHYLYVFGGLLYNDKSHVFVMEKEPYMYRLDLRHRIMDNKVYNSTWERILPKFNKDSLSLYNLKNPENILNRGQVRGGLWKNQKLVIYGGLQVNDVSSFTYVQQVDNPMGDVWCYDLILNTWEVMYSYDTIHNVPIPRTSHGATVVGDELVIYGGLGKIKTNIWDGSTEWEELNDIWIFDLVKKIWKERKMKQDLKRSYHSLVGWKSHKEGSIIASFGGYTTTDNPLNNEEPIAYVFDDLLVSSPRLGNNNSISTWRKAMEPLSNIPTQSISNRYEHSAVLSPISGYMFVWGGRFETTNQVHGMWCINLLGDGSNITYQNAHKDQLYNLDSTTSPLYVITTTIMFISLLVLYLYSRQNNLEQEGINYQDSINLENGSEDTTSSVLDMDVIDLLPLKMYSKNEKKSHINNVNGSPKLNKDYDVNINDNLDDDNSCAICLVPYIQGEMMRSLPCHHEFHKSCIDPWLRNHGSCPSCRYSMENLQSYRSFVNNRTWNFERIHNILFRRSGENQRIVDPIPATNSTTDDISSVSVTLNDILSRTRRRIQNVTNVHNPNDERLNDLELESSYISSLEHRENIHNSTILPSVSVNIPIEGRFHSILSLGRNYRIFPVTIWRQRQRRGTISSSSLNNPLHLSEQ